jgi:hypothetical protein
VVETMAGSPEVGSERLEGRGVLRVGEWLTTDASSSARVEVAGLGSVRIDGGSKIRIKDVRGGKRVMDLREGAIHAFITAPPRVFFVDTPSARAVDLGCEYRLTVDAAGDGMLAVDLGYVLLEGGGYTSTVPMNGGMCYTRSGRGPGTPFFADASDVFKTELKRLDFGGGGPAALEAVLAQARPRDALSLWHLLARVSGPERSRVYEVLARLKPPPDGVTERGVLGLDQHMMERWWDAMRPF